MRHQDELILAFRSQEEIEPRRVVLRQMADLPVVFDTLDVLDVVREEERQVDSPLAAQCTTVLSELAPSALACDYGYDPAAEEWRDHPFDSPAPEKSKRPSAPAASWLSVTGAPGLAKSPESETWAAAGSHLFAPCVAPLVARARDGAPAVRALALRCLMRFLHPRARAALVESSVADPLAAIALAQTGDPALEDVFLERLRGASAHRPELVRLLGRFPGKKTLVELRKALRENDPTVRLAAASALEGFGDLDPLGAAKPYYIATEDPWLLVHLTESLVHCASAEALPVMRELFAGLADRPQVQVALVRAISNIGGPEAVAFCLAQLDRPDPPVQAVALEGLVLLGHPLAELKEKLPALLSSDYPRLAQNAALVMTKLDPEVTTRTVVGLLRSESKTARFRAAFLLGYLRSEVALKVTTKLAIAEPSPGVRTELLRCLSRYPAAEAGPALAASFAQSEPEVRARAIQLWARTRCVSIKETAERLVALLQAESDPGVRAQILTLLGQAGDVDSLPALAHELGATDRTVAAGAAYGVGLAGASGLADDVGVRAAGGDPLVRARMAATLWYLGDARAPTALAPLLAEPTTFESAALVLEEICLMLPRLPASPRHMMLQHLLSSHLRTPGYEAFSKERLGIQSGLILRPVSRGVRRVAADMNLSGTVDVESVRELAKLDMNEVRKLPGGDRLTGRNRASRAAAQEARDGGFAGKALLTGAALVIALAGAAVVRALFAPSPAAPVEGLVVLGTVGEAKGGPAKSPAALVRGQVLKAPFTLATGKDSRITARMGPVAAARLVLSADSQVTVTKLSTVHELSNGFALELSGLKGECLLDLTSGAPQLALDLGSATLEAQRCSFRCTVGADRVVLRVASGPVTLKAGGQTVSVGSGERKEWGLAEGPVSKQ